MTHLLTLTLALASAGAGLEKWTVDGILQVKQVLRQDSNLQPFG